MSEALLADQSVGTKAKSAKVAPMRSAKPKAAQFLIPVWGELYIDRFLEVCLPTLLAPGNIPAVAKVLPCKFVFLTSTEGRKIFSGHPGYRFLERYCTMDIQVIDDLITGDNHSTTITLAFERAVRSVGAEMLDTCFFFLISDYIMADGSLGNVLKRMLGGASGVLAGNFQVIEEDAAATFYERFHRRGAELALAPRELVDWALGHIHPMTAANTINFPLVRSSHANRLFWRVDENTLIGRFYLMHMICIRPELGDFVIGASCDYSFIPEMCPSDKVEIMTDSDDYLVIEMQPRLHERGFLRLGDTSARDLASSLCQWATAHHRKNAKTQVVFHSGDLPRALPDFSRLADDYLDEVDRYLSAAPQPHRDHPYWISAIEAHRWAKRLKFGEEVDPSAVPVQGMSNTWVLRHVRSLCFGRVPHVRLLHPLWIDFRVAVSCMRKLLADKPRRLLVLSPLSTPFAHWFSDVAASTTEIQTRRLRGLGENEYRLLVNSFDACFLMVEDSELDRVQSTVERVRPLLRLGARLFVFSICMRGLGAAPIFLGQLTEKSGMFVDRTMPMTASEFVIAGPLRTRVSEAMFRLYTAMLRSPTVYYPVAFLLAPFLMLGSFIGNLLSFHPRSHRRRGEPVQVP